MTRHYNGLVCVVKHYNSFWLTDKSESARYTSLQQSELIHLRESALDRPTAGDLAIWWPV